MHQLLKNTVGVETIFTQKLPGNFTIHYKEMANSEFYYKKYSNNLWFIYNFEISFLQCVLDVGCLISWLPSLEFYIGKAQQHLHTIFSNTLEFDSYHKWRFEQSAKLFLYYVCTKLT